MNLEGLTCAEIEDTYSRCKRALEAFRAPTVTPALIDEVKLRIFHTMSECATEEAAVDFLEKEMARLDEEGLLLWQTVKGEPECDECEEPSEDGIAHVALFRHGRVIICESCFYGSNEDSYDTDELFDDYLRWKKKQKKLKKDVQV